MAARKMSGTTQDCLRIYDVGFNTGQDAEGYLRLGYRVIGIEADPVLAGQARICYSEALRSGQLTLIEGSISDEIRPIFYRFENSALGTVQESWVQRNRDLGAKVQACVETEGLNLSDVILRHGEAFYVKIDIEGSDHVALKQLADSVHRPMYISIESSKTSLREVAWELRTLCAMGYSAFQAIPQHKIGSSSGSHLKREYPVGSSGPFGPLLQSRWYGPRIILLKYVFIYLRYLLYGDRAIVAPGYRGKIGRTLRGRLGTSGWWDTHARHCSHDRELS